MITASEDGTNNNNNNKSMVSSCQRLINHCQWYRIDCGKRFVGVAVLASAFSDYLLERERMFSQRQDPFDDCFSSLTSKHRGGLNLDCAYPSAEGTVSAGGLPKFRC